MECKNDNHRPRNNKYGITWCVKCGRLFTKPCEKDLVKTDKLIIDLRHKITNNDKNSNI